MISEDQPSACPAAAAARRNRPAPARKTTGEFELHALPGQYRLLKVPPPTGAFRTGDHPSWLPFALSRTSPSISAFRLVVSAKPGDHRQHALHQPATPKPQPMPWWQWKPKPFQVEVMIVRGYITGVIHPLSVIPATCPLGKEIYGYTFPGGDCRKTNPCQPQSSPPQPKKGGTARRRTRHLTCRQVVEQRYWIKQPGMSATATCSFNAATSRRQPEPWV